LEAFLFFLNTAESIQRDFGYPEGLLTHQLHYCTYRDGEYQVFIDIYGKVIDIDDHDLDNTIWQARNFPKKLYKEFSGFSRTLQSICQQVFAGNLETDPGEPLGTLNAYQNAVPIRISKEAKQGLLMIVQELGKLAAKQLRSRQDANALREVPSGQGGKYPEGDSFCVFKMCFPRWSCQMIHSKSLWLQLRLRLRGRRANARSMFMVGRYICKFKMDGRVK
jgi:hypothetical protein